VTRTVRERLQDGRPTLSFEFSPPKTTEEESRLWRVIRELEALHPSFVSVTYGAGGSTRDRTIEITERIAVDTTLLPVAHLTAVNHSIAELRAIVGRFADAGIVNLLALRGDPPGDPNGVWQAHPDGVEYASELIELLRAHGDFSVGVAAFPFKHPRSRTVEDDTQWFIAKCRSGADYAITQMVFDAEDYLRMRDRMVAAGCDIPIIVGVMPVTNMGTIARSEQLSGAPFPPALLRDFEAIADDPAAVRQVGIKNAIALGQRLLDEGAPGLHFITMNYSKAAREVIAELPLAADG